ncbi:MAG: DUF5060 domain-containing protein [Bacteroidales bacterium]|nr:DUF5060 domain-containing protein [Bacteroidales bacterium]
MKEKCPVKICFLIMCLCLSAGSYLFELSAQVSGEMKVWHSITFTFNGPQASEYDTVNPFTDYRFDMEFSNGTQKINVPGYFAADGKAGETSARSGNKWRAHFCPPEEGIWNYRVHFLKGRDIAIADDPEDGEGCYMNGYSGSVRIEKNESNDPDFLLKGRLQYTGNRYLRHAGTGEAFLKGGADSPENFLAYSEFDGTYYGGKNVARSGEAVPGHGLHQYGPHIGDWREGDPQWKKGKGKGIIGALNYLSSKGMNSIYLLTLNILGDGDDVWPYTDRNERYRFDCSKLDQWEIVFSHAEKLGIMLHFVLQETENECLLDCGYLDVQRKLYLRELAARFSHHTGIAWNLGEEHNPTSWSPYGQTYRDTKLMADYLRSVDPYDNFIVVHTHSDTEQKAKDLNAYLGFRNIEGPSLQCGNVDEVHETTRLWIEKSGDSLHQWVVCCDEIGQHWKGALPDSFDPGHDTIRHKVLWGNLMAGGAGVEWYFGYMYPHNDLNCEDWRSRDKLWDQTKIALDFFCRELPFHEMKNSDEITKSPDDYCLSRDGDVYAVYLPEGKATEIMLKKGNYSVMWFNPRSGGALQPGTIKSISGGGYKTTGSPPVSDGKDWVCLIKKT